MYKTLKALSTCQTMECMSESTSIDFLCQLLLVSCFLTSITFKSYSYFDSSNIHTHAAIHITFHFLSPCCQCYPLVVQSLIFTQLLQHCMVSAVLFTSIFFLLHAITINLLRINFCVDRVCISCMIEWKWPQRNSLVMQCHSIKAHAIFHILLFPKNYYNIGLSHVLSTAQY